MEGMCLFVGRSRTDARQKALVMEISVTRKSPGRLKKTLRTIEISWVLLYHLFVLSLNSHYTIKSKMHEQTSCAQYKAGMKWCISLGLLTWPRTERNWLTEVKFSQTRHAIVVVSEQRPIRSRLPSGRDQDVFQLLVEYPGEVLGNETIPLLGISHFQFRIFNGNVESQRCARIIVSDGVEKRDMIEWWFVYWWRCGFDFKWTGLATELKLLPIKIPNWGCERQNTPRARIQNPR